MASPMTSPLDRPEGSSHVLRYRGTVAPAALGGEIPTPVPLATFPKPNASFPSDTPVVTPLVVVPAPPNPIALLPYFVAYARFLLADPGPIPGVLDPVALANYRRRFLESVYDDSDPAGISPHGVIPALNDPGLNNGELILNAFTWAQNIQVRSSQIDLNVIAQDIGMKTGVTAATGQGSTGVTVVRDTLTSGLGLNTGLPVIVVPFVVLAQSNGQPQPTFLLQSFGVDLTIEIPHSIGR